MTEEEHKAAAEAFVEDVMDVNDQIEILARILVLTGVNEQLVLQRVIELETE